MMNLKEERIFVIHNDHDQARLLIRQLHKLGCQTGMASNHKKALQSLNNKPWSLVLLGSKSTGDDSFEDCKCLKSENAAHEIPVILLINKNQASHASLAFQSGAADFIIKPVDPIQLMARISHQLDLVRANSEIQRQIKEKRQAVDNALDNINRISHFKEIFFELIAHELKTPLTSIFGYAEVLEECCSNRELMPFIKVILQECQRLENSILNITDLAFANFGEEKLKIQTVNLNRVIQQALERVSGKLSDRPQLDLRIQATDINFNANETKMVQLCANLLDNALFFSPDQGHIEITGEKRTSGFLLSITDEGSTIPKSQLDSLFDQINLSERKGIKTRGTGIGLNIAYKIVQMHQGAIWAENTNNGVCFKVHMPYSQTKRRNYRKQRGNQPYRA